MPLSDLDALLRSTDDALCATLRGTLLRDRHEARGVLRRSGCRRTLLLASRDAVRGRPWVPAPSLAATLQFVDDVGRVGSLVDDLARHLVAGGDRAGLSPTARRTVTLLMDAGDRRLRQLADGLVGPGLDASYRSCGQALFEVADRGARDRSTTASLCSAMAVTLLQASRHAGRAA